MITFPRYWRIALRGFALGFGLAAFLVFAVTAILIMLNALYPPKLPPLGGDKTPGIIEIAIVVGGALSLVYGGGIGLLTASLTWLYFRYMPRRWTVYVGRGGAICGIAAVVLVAIPHEVQHFLELRQLNAMLPYTPPADILAESMQYIVIWLFLASLVAAVGAMAAQRYFSYPNVDLSQTGSQVGPS